MNIINTLLKELDNSNAEEIMEIACKNMDRDIYANMLAKLKKRKSWVIKNFLIYYSKKHFLKFGKPWVF